MDKVFELFLLQCNACGYNKDDGLVYLCNEDILSNIPPEHEIIICLKLDNTIVFKASYLGNILDVSQAIRIEKVTLYELICWVEQVDWYDENCRNCSNYIGEYYRGNKLVCAIHPYGQKNCPDFKS
ncbi:MAG: hypothetical protein QNJ70_27550 [Xenococcaceae cyanobacterium MO_207.B15]|nr:hypothetical protein [Xenococcaceae cyanobacterium MO_207.B15]